MAKLTTGARNKLKPPPFKPMPAKTPMPMPMPVMPKAGKGKGRAGGKKGCK